MNNNYEKKVYSQDYRNLNLAERDDLNIILYVAGIVGCLILTYVVYKSIRSLVEQYYFHGNPNDWVLVIRNGELVNCGIGLTGFRGLFDQVVTIPAKVHKVDFATQQVTVEMQGLEVSGMIVWTINRASDGPLKAYRNLGEDIGTNNPHSANQKLVSMSNAIVRNCIANSTIDDIIKNRKMIRDAVREEMGEVVKGWGVWIETIEITDVTILSSSLFKDMQTKFREEQKQKAEMQRMLIDDEIKTERLKSNIAMTKKKSDSEMEEAMYKAQKELEKEKENAQIYIEKKNIENAKYESDLQQKIMKKEYETKSKQQMNLQQLEYDLSEQKNEIRRSENEMELKEAKHRLVMMQEQHDQALEKSKREFDQSMQFKQLEMLKPFYSDPNYMKYMSLKSCEEIYKGQNISELKIVDMGSSDPVGNVVKKFLQINKELDNSV